jgi:hypothetical protein
MFVDTSGIAPGYLAANELNEAQKVKWEDQSMIVTCALTSNPC